MDQCFGYDDLVVPKDQSISDGYQSHGSFWSNWELDSHNSFQFPQKYFISNANRTSEQLRSGSQTSGNQLDKDLSSCSSFGGRQGSDNSSFQYTSATRQEQDYQLNGIAKIEHMDDHFLSSLIDDLQEMDDNQNSPCFSSESQDCMNPADELWTEAAVDSGSVSSYGFTTGSSCTRSNFQSMKHGTTKTGLQQQKVPAFVSVPSEEDDCTNLQGQDEPSCEEAALYELDLVMTQMTTKTRICFRDALYRLAKNSRPLGVVYEEVDTDFPSWLEGSGMEQQTNQIDRAIANMMFNKMELDVMDYHMSTPDRSDQDFVPSHPQCYYTNVSDESISPDDAEVPVSGHRGCIGGSASKDSGRDV